VNLRPVITCAALLAGAAVAWFSAAEGGSERERGVIPVWDWSLRRRNRPKATAWRRGELAAYSAAANRSFGSRV